MNCPKCDSDKCLIHPKEEGGDWDEVFAKYIECLECGHQWNDDGPGAEVDHAYEQLRDLEMTG